MLFALLLLAQAQQVPLAADAAALSVWQQCVRDGAAVLAHKGYAWSPFRTNARRLTKAAMRDCEEQFAALVAQVGEKQAQSEQRWLRRVLIDQYATELVSISVEDI